MKLEKKHEEWRVEDAKITQSADLTDIVDNTPGVRTGGGSEGVLTPPKAADFQKILGICGGSLPQPPCIFKFCFLPPPPTPYIGKLQTPLYR